MPNRDGTGPGGRGRRCVVNQAPDCRNNRSSFKGNKSQNFQGNKTKQIQSPQNSSTTLKAIGMMIFSLSAAILPLARKLDKLLSSNDGRDKLRLENKPKDPGNQELVHRLPEKLD